MTAIRRALTRSSLTAFVMIFVALIILEAIGQGPQVQAARINRALGR